MTTKGMMKVAKAEIDAWSELPRGLVLAILFSFIHRVTTGETIEETFFHSPTTEGDYEI